MAQDTNLIFDLDVHRHRFPLVCCTMASRGRAPVRVKPALAPRARSARSSPGSRSATPRTSPRSSPPSRLRRTGSTLDLEAAVQNPLAGFYHMGTERDDPIYTAREEAKAEVIMLLNECPRKIRLLLQLAQKENLEEDAMDEDTLSGGAFDPNDIEEFDPSWGLCDRVGGPHVKSQLQNRDISFFTDELTS